MNNADAANDRSPCQGVTRIKSNVYLGDQTGGRFVKTSAALNTAPVECDCVITSLGGSSCAKKCLNRQRHVECIPVFCACGHNCQNQKIRKGVHAKTLIFDAGRKGQGLQAAEDIVQGTLVTEYVGEVITANEAEKRCVMYEQEHVKHMYLFQTRSGAVIDATVKGNEARFINHSCSPNCQAEYWAVEGRERVGIFAIKPIPSGQEITYDYHSICTKEPVTKCLCNSAQCRGFLDTPIPQQAKGKPRPYSAMIGEELRARPNSDNMSQSSCDNSLATSTETASSACAHPQPGSPAAAAAILHSVPSSTRLWSAKSCNRGSAKTASSSPLQRASRSQVKSAARRTVKSSAINSSNTGRSGKAADRAEQVLLLTWGCTAPRTVAGSKQQRGGRTHSWGCSLSDAAAIPASNRTLAKKAPDDLAAEDATQGQGAASGLSNQQQPSALPTAEPSNSTKDPAQRLSTRQAAIAAAAAKFGVQHQAIASGSSTQRQPPNLQFAVLKSGADAFQAKELQKNGGNMVIQQNSSVHRCSASPAAFYQDLHHLLLQLGPKEAERHTPLEAAQLQVHIADGLGVDMSLPRCQALASLATDPAFRGKHRLPLGTGSPLAVTAQQAAPPQQTVPAQQAVLAQQTAPVRQANLAQQTSSAEHTEHAHIAELAQRSASAQPAVPAHQAKPTQAVVSDQQTKPAHEAVSREPDQESVLGQQGTPGLPARNPQQAHPALQVALVEQAETAQQMVPALSYFAAAQAVHTLFSQSPVSTQCAVPAQQAAPDQAALLVLKGPAPAPLPLSPHRSSYSAQHTQHGQHSTLGSPIKKPKLSSLHQPLAPEQAHGHMSMRDRLANARDLSQSPIRMLAPPTEPPSKLGLGPGNQQGTGSQVPVQSLDIESGYTVLLPSQEQQQKQQPQQSHPSCDELFSFKDSSGVDRATAATAAAVFKASSLKALTAKSPLAAAAAEQPFVATSTPTGPQSETQARGIRAAISEDSASDRQFAATALTDIARTAAAPDQAVGRSLSRTVDIALTEDSDAVIASQARKQMPPPPVRPPLQARQAVGSGQCATPAGMCPPHMPSPALRLGLVADSSSKLHDVNDDSSSESDVDIENMSATHEDTIAAWIQKQRLCPEPFLSAADYAALREARLPKRRASGIKLRPDVPLYGSSSPPHVPPSLPPQAPLPASTSLQLGASPSTASKSSKHGVKPPLYPAKRMRSPDAETAYRQQAGPHPAALATDASVRSSEALVHEGTARVHRAKDTVQAHIQHVSDVHKQPSDGQHGLIIAEKESQLAQQSASEAWRDTGPVEAMMIARAATLQHAASVAQPSKTADEPPECSAHSHAPTVKQKAAATTTGPTAADSPPGADIQHKSEGKAAQHKRPHPACKKQSLVNMLADPRHNAFEIALQDMTAGRNTERQMAAQCSALSHKRTAAVEATNRQDLEIRRQPGTHMTGLAHGAAEMASAAAATATFIPYVSSAAPSTATHPQSLAEALAGGPVAAAGTDTEQHSAEGKAAQQKLLTHLGFEKRSLLERIADPKHDTFNMLAERAATEYQDISAERNTEQHCCPPSYLCTTPLKAATLEDEKDQGLPVKAMIGLADQVAVHRPALKSHNLQADASASEARLATASILTSLPPVPGALPSTAEHPWSLTEPLAASLPTPAQQHSLAATSFSSTDKASPTCKCAEKHMPPKSPAAILAAVVKQVLVAMPVSNSPTNQMAANLNGSPHEVLAFNDLALLPCIPQAPKQNLRAWKTVPNGQPDSM